MKPKVVVAEEIAAAGIAALSEHCEVDLAVGVDREELKRRLVDARGLLVRSATTVDAELIAAAPNLDVIGRAGIGVDNIDLDAATAAGVLVVNAPNANVISAAEHTMALILAQARRIPEADASLRKGEWNRSKLGGVELHGKTLGILGLGKIGSLVAERARAFGMSLVAYDPFVSEERASRMGVNLVSKDEVLAAADFLTIHLPRNRETEGLLNAAAFRQMKSTAVVVNVARGGIVVESDLADAVANGVIAGAAIDVYDVEPTTSSPVFEQRAIVVTPHLGASTVEAQDKAGIAVAESVAATLRGELVLTGVNLDLGPNVPSELIAFLPLAAQLGRVFVALARGVPQDFTVIAEGAISEFSVKSLVLAVLKGALSTVSERPVSYVNALSIAAQRGVVVREMARASTDAYQSSIRITGTLDGRDRVVAGSISTHKGPVLTEIDGYYIEVPLGGNMLMLRNDDTPGVIGRVGGYLGKQGINIADMVVGRTPVGAAMMGLCLDQPVSEEQLADILSLAGVLSVRYFELG